MNGTPLRRVAQAYVIATQTKVDVSTVKLPDNLNDDYFRRSKPEKKKKDGDIFSDGKKVSRYGWEVSGLGKSSPFKRVPTHSEPPVTTQKLNYAVSKSADALLAWLSSLFSIINTILEECHTCMGAGAGLVMISTNESYFNDA